MNTPMNTLLSSAHNSATSASRFADEARANMARAHSTKAELSGQFSQLLRGYDKPTESPKPAAESKPAAAPAPAAPPKPEGKTETQRQEARSAAPKKSADPAKSAATTTATATTTAATASSAQAANDESEAVDGKEADQLATADVASPETSIVAELVAPLPQPIPLPLAVPVEVQSQLQLQAQPHMALQAQVEVPVPVPLDSTPGTTGLPGTAKRQSGEIALTAVGGEPDDGKARTTASTSANASATTSTSRVAQAAAEDAKAKAKDDSGAHSASDFAAKLADAVQAQPAVLRSADSGPRAHIDAAALSGIASPGAPSAHTTLNPAGTSAGTPSPARVDVASSLFTPGFASEMAARLSVLAADGVQTAQLHLNPADMGPVAVQIVLEGQQARIEFQADQADTRAVLERSLPDLAAALRDSGLTLSGGGVFQQFAGQDSSSAQDRNEANGSRRSGRAGADALPDTLSDLPPRTAALARQTQGVVDLYA